MKKTSILFAVALVLASSVGSFFAYQDELLAQLPDIAAYSIPGQRSDRVNITANPTTVEMMGSVTLSWQNTNVASCGIWSSMSHWITTNVANPQNGSMKHGPITNCEQIVMSCTPTEGGGELLNHVDVGTTDSACIGTGSMPGGIDLGGALGGGTPEIPAGTGGGNQDGGTTGGGNQDGGVGLPDVGQLPTLPEDDGGTPEIPAGTGGGNQDGGTTGGGNQGGETDNSECGCRTVCVNNECTEECAGDCQNGGGQTGGGVGGQVGGGQMPDLGQLGGQGAGLGAGLGAGTGAQLGNLGGGQGAGLGGLAGNFCGIINQQLQRIQGNFSIPADINQRLRAVCGTQDQGDQNAQAFSLEAGTGQSTHFIWHTGFFTRDGQTWEPVELEGETTSDATANWFVGEANADVPLSDAEAGRLNFLAVYQCDLINNEWKCGCTGSINTCTDHGEYSIQAFRAP